MTRLSEYQSTSKDEAKAPSTHPRRHIVVMKNPARSYSKEGPFSVVPRDKDAICKVSTTQIRFDSEEKKASSKRVSKQKLLTLDNVKVAGKGKVSTNPRLLLAKDKRAGN